MLGIDNMEWVYSDKLSKEILYPNYVGKVYLDLNNNVYYIYAESN